MATNELPHSVQPLPAPAQIALALVILKSKPCDISIEDFLGQLRARIVEGPAPARKLTAQHLDSAGYWKDAFDRAEQEKAALLGRLHDQETQKAADTSISSPPAGSPLASGRKRRREDTPVAKANSRSKRRVDPSRTPEAPAEKDAFNGHEDTTKLLQAFFTLRLHLRRKPTALSAVQASASHLCQAISVTVRSVGGNTKGDDARTYERANVWSAIRSTYNALPEAIEVLQNKSSNAGSAKTLIAESAEILTELLKCLQSIVVREQPLRREVRKRSASREIRVQLLGLTNLISGMMVDLDLTKVAHRELFDGLLCTFLDHLGSSLALAVFSEPVTQGMPQFSDLLPLRRLSAGAEELGQVDVLTVLKEAPYLIDILRKTRPRMDQRGHIENSGCAAAIVDKMQNTLLRALFGDQDQAFRDSLQRPAEVERMCDSENPMADTEEDDTTSEWFIGEVWSNVGWNILTNQMN